jgi:uncharacterized Ntn-hydrolase superfamily protein
MRRAAFLFALAVAGDVLPASAQLIEEDPDLGHTFSIIGRDPATGDLGVAVQSNSLAVGSRVRGGKGGVAVFAHQSGSNAMYSTIGVELLEAGWSPQEALDFMVRADPEPNRRQVAILDIQGRTAAYTSGTITDWKGHKCGVDYCASGNSLVGPEVVEAMARAWEASYGSQEPLAERLLAALTAGQDVGGQTSGMQSAGIMILRPRSLQDFGDRALDLRVDDADNPFVELKRVLAAFRARELMQQAGGLLASGDLPGAMEKARAAHDKHPELDNPYVTMADVHLRMGKKADALAALRSAVELNAANKKQLPRNAAFASLHADPEFLAIVR